jgi:hypothetical protein
MSLISKMTNAPVKLGESIAPWSEKTLDLTDFYRTQNKRLVDRNKQTWAEAAEAINAEQRTRALSSLSRMMGRPDAACYPHTEPGDEPRKVLRQPLENGYANMSSQGDNLFIKKHGGILVHDDPSMSHSDNERIFQASNISPDKSKRYGYNSPGEDKRAYDLHESTMSAMAMEKLDAIRDSVDEKTWDRTMQVVNVVGQEVIKEFVRSQYGEDEIDETSHDTQAPDVTEENARRLANAAFRKARRIKLNSEPRPKPCVHLNAEPRKPRFGGRLPGC